MVGRQVGSSSHSADIRPGARADVSIALYSLFTAMPGLSVGLFDSVVSLPRGIGNGAESVADPGCWPTALGESSAKISGIMMTGGAIGRFLGSLGTGLVAIRLTHRFLT